MIRSVFARYHLPRRRMRPKCTRTHYSPISCIHCFRHNIQPKVVHRCEGNEDLCRPDQDSKRQEQPFQNSGETQNSSNWLQTTSAHLSGAIMTIDQDLDHHRTTSLDNLKRSIISPPKPFHRYTGPALSPRHPDPPVTQRPKPRWYH
jgi:hypothetical protein